MFGIASAALSGDEVAQEIRTVWSWLLLQMHPLRPPLDAERGAVVTIRTVAEGTESQCQGCRPFKVFAVAPLNEVDPVRMLVLVDVPVEEAIRPTACIAPTFLDGRLRFETDRRHPNDLSPMSARPRAQGDGGGHS